MPRGAILGGNLKEIHPVDLKDPALIQEYVTHSWYKYPTKARACIRSTASPSPNFELGKGTKGTKTAIDNVDESAKYSWSSRRASRASRWIVGPLARYVTYYAMGIPEFRNRSTWC